MDVCYCDMFSVVNVYLDHLKFCVVCLIVEGMSVVVNVMLSLMSVMSPPPALYNILVCTAVDLQYDEISLTFTVGSVWCY